MKKKAKKFFKYFMFLLALLVVLTGAFFAILYFSPGSSILGYQYVQFEETIAKELSQSELGSQGVNSLKIEGGSVEVVISPNTESENIKISYTQKVRGFAKTTNSVATLKTGYALSQFEEHTSDYTSAVISIVEPSGALVSSTSIVHVYLPQSYKVPILYCKSSKNISYFAKTSQTVDDKTTEYATNVEDMYFYTQGSGKISLSCDNGKKIGLKTERGDVVLSGTTFSAEKIKFDTDSGKFDFYSDGNSILNLSDKLEIMSYGKKGVKINIDTLNGNLVVNCNGGEYKIGTIGSDAQKSVTLNASNSKFTFGTVNGSISLQNGGDTGKNVFIATTINNLSTTNNTFEVGSGSVTINKLVGTSSLSSTSGNLYVGEIDLDSSIYALSDSGEINLTYQESRTSKLNTSVNVFSKTGDIYLNNISGLLKVNILSKSEKAKLDIVFTAVCNVDDNVIKAEDRDVSMTLKGFTDDFKLRALTTTKALFDTKIDQSQVSNNDRDYLLGDNGYKDYVYQYRCFYSLDESMSNIGSYAKLMVSTSGVIRMFADFS